MVRHVPSDTEQHGYPRPLLRREQWLNLNGTWDFAIDRDGRWNLPQQVEWKSQIQVPFAPETEASGVGDTGFFQACWYRRRFTVDGAGAERVILHFGAVDYEACVWLNDRLVATHQGGYTPFEADVTDALVPGEQTVVVQACDDPHDLSKPRGKQDWQLEPHGIWYERTSGIWQTVWVEKVSHSYVGWIAWTTSLERWEIGLEVQIAGARRPGLTLTVLLEARGRVLARDTYEIIAGEVSRRIALSDPGIDDYRNELLWTPSTPTLIDATLELRDETGCVLDRVESYTALRSIGVQGDRFVLNGRPYLLRMVLDQGYWPKTGLTPPDDAAVRKDVELVKAMGFNGVRKHQKVEDPRYLYWADVLGLAVWEEMPSAYRYNRTSIDRLTDEWSEVLERDASHPCVVALVPFNESWGVPDLPDSSAQRHYVQALYHLTKTLDATRPVVGNDGWESAATDLIGIHDYDVEPDRVRLRYGAHELIPRLFQRERPGGRLLVLEGHGHKGQPILLTEFGGIAYSPDPEAWGYSQVASETELADRYCALLEVVRNLQALAGFCYTQFADTYQEANGLLYADRTPKFPIADIAAATRGPKGARDLQIELAWRERMMSDIQRQVVLPVENALPPDR
jgi:beta-galactosidase/beta-glucuronidase